MKNLETGLNYFKEQLNNSEIGNDIDCLLLMIGGLKVLELKALTQKENEIAHEIQEIDYEVKQRIKKMIK